MYILYKGVKIKNSNPLTKSMKIYSFSCFDARHLNHIKAYVCFYMIKNKSLYFLLKDLSF